MRSTSSAMDSFRIVPGKDSHRLVLPMRHHGVPTRLLDWSTNALAGLFFAVEEYSRQQDASSRSTAPPTDADHGYVAIWVLDAYWLANRLSDDEWDGPLLPYSEDNSKYVPPIEQLVERIKDARALVPKHAMPIEPPAICWTKKSVWNETTIARKRSCASKRSASRYRIMMPSCGNLRNWESPGARCFPIWRASRNSCAGNTFIKLAAMPSRRAASDILRRRPWFSSLISDSRARSAPASCGT